MEDGFLMYEKNKVVNVSKIELVTEELLMAGMRIQFLSPYGWQVVDKEYEPEWRKRFDLND